MPKTLAQVRTKLLQAVDDFGDLPDVDKTHPYVADAKSFAQQAMVCIDKQIETNS